MSVSKDSLREMRGELIIQWNVIGSKIELIDFLLAPTVGEALEQLIGDDAVTEQE